MRETDRQTDRGTQRERERERGGRGGQRYFFVCLGLLFFLCWLVGWLGFCFVCFLFVLFLCCWGGGGGRQPYIMSHQGDSQTDRDKLKAREKGRGGETRQPVSKAETTGDRDKRKNRESERETVLPFKPLITSDPAWRPLTSR